jgi:hypothetical protein
MSFSRRLRTRGMTATYVETMTTFVRFRPRDPKQRVVRKEAPLDRWRQTAGHFVTANAACESLLLHHYIRLSLDHLRSQYESRVYALSDLARHWHRSRRGQIAAPTPGQLMDRQRDASVPVRPVAELPVFGPPPVLRRPAAERFGDLVIACTDRDVLRRIVASVADLRPTLQAIPLAAPLPTPLPHGPVLHVISDGRSRLAAPDAGTPRQEAVAWCRFVAGVRQEILGLGRSQEVRAENVDAGSVDLGRVLDGLLASNAITPRPGFTAHAPLVPWALRDGAVRAFEEIAGPLLRDLGYATDRALAVPQTC